MRYSKVVKKKKLYIIRFCMYFYIFVFFLFEGPGCSSIGAGAFCEHGPFKPSGNILLKNDYSWNKGNIS